MLSLCSNCKEALLNLLNFKNSKNPFIVLYFLFVLYISESYKRNYVKLNLGLFEIDISSATQTPIVSNSASNFLKSHILLIAPIVKNHI